MPRLKGQGWRKGRMGEIRSNDLHIRCRIDLSRTRVSLPTQRANNRRERESQLPRFVYLLFCTPLIHPCSTVYLFLRVASVHLHVSLLPTRYSFPTYSSSSDLPVHPSARASFNFVAVSNETVLSLDRIILLFPFVHTCTRFLPPPDMNPDNCINFSVPSFGRNVRSSLLSDTRGER